MASQKKIAIIVIFVIVIAAVVLLGLLFGLLLRSDNGIELQVWPRGADGSAQPVISYTSTNPKSYMPWVNSTTDFLSTYRSHGFHQRCGYSDWISLASCLNMLTPALNKKKMASSNYYVDLKAFHPCTSDNRYNYRTGAPCIFLKLDKLLDWTPNAYEMISDNDEMTDDKLLGKMLPNLNRTPHLDFLHNQRAIKVTIECGGVDQADKQYIGPVKYIPSRGLPTYYFPYKTQEDYLSPLVAVLFEKPWTGILINVECKALANIAYWGTVASVRFQLMVD